jgi:hypothetical protein
VRTQTQGQLPLDISTIVLHNNSMNLWVKNSRGLLQVTLKYIPSNEGQLEERIEQREEKHKFK